MSAAPPPDLHRLFNKVCRGAWDCWVRRGRSKESARTHDVSAAPPPDLHRLFNKVCRGPGIVGSGGAVKGECEDT